jgi:hypothetical protein
VGSRTGLDSLEKTKSLALMEIYTIHQLSTRTSMQKLDPNIVTQQRKRTFKTEKLLHISQLIEKHVSLHNGKFYKTTFSDNLRHTAR